MSRLVSSFGGVLLHCRGGNDTNNQPHPFSGKATLGDFIVRRQGRVARSTFSAESNGLVDRIEHMLSPQVTLHPVYHRTRQSLDNMIDLFEGGGLYLRSGVAVDVRAVCGAVVAIYAREPQGSNFKLHLISVGDRLAQGIVGRTH